MSGKAAGKPYSPPSPASGKVLMSPRERKGHMEVTMRYWCLVIGVLAVVATVLVMIFMPSDRATMIVAPMSALSTWMINYALTGKHEQS